MHLNTTPSPETLQHVCNAVPKRLARHGKVRPEEYETVNAAVRGNPIYAKREDFITTIAGLIANGQAVMNPIRPGAERCTKDDISCVNLLPIDVDNSIDKPWALKQVIEALPLAPNIICETPSSTPERPKYRLFYLTDKPIPIEAGHEMQRAMCKFMNRHTENGTGLKNGKVVKTYVVDPMGNANTLWNPAKSPEHVRIVRKELITFAELKVAFPWVRATYDEEEREKAPVVAADWERILSYPPIADAFAENRRFEDDVLFTLATNFARLKGGAALYERLLEEAGCSMEKLEKVHRAKRDGAFPGKLPGFNQSLYNWVRGAEIDRVNHRRILTLEEAYDLIHKEFSKAVAAGPGNITIICAPTGVGKTEMMMSIIDHRSLVTFPTHALKEEVKARCDARGIEVAVMPDPGEVQEYALEVMSPGEKERAMRYPGMVKKIVFEIAQGKRAAKSPEKAQACVKFMEDYNYALSRTDLPLFTTHADTAFNDYPDRPNIIYDEDPWGSFVQANIESPYYKTLPGHLKPKHKDCWMEISPEAQDHLNVPATLWWLDSRNGEVFLASHHLPNWEKKNVVVLSATPQITCWKTLHPHTEFVSVGEIEHKGKIVQFKDDQTSRSAMRKGRPPILDSVPRNVDLVTYQNAPNLPDDRTPDMYFGNLSGKDGLKGRCSVICGQNTAPHALVAFYAYVATRGARKRFKEDRSMQGFTHEQTGFKGRRMTYENYLLQQIDLDFTYDSVMQAIGRPRTLRTEAAVMYCGTFPLGPSVTILDREDAIQWLKVMSAMNDGARQGEALLAFEHEMSGFSNNAKTREMYRNVVIDVKKRNKKVSTWKPADDPDYLPTINQWYAIYVSRDKSYNPVKRAKAQKIADEYHAKYRPKVKPTDERSKNIYDWEEEVALAREEAFERRQERNRLIREGYIDDLPEIPLDDDVDYDYLAELMDLDDDPGDCDSSETPLDSPSDASEASLRDPGQPLGPPSQDCGDPPQRPLRDFPRNLPGTPIRDTGQPLRLSSRDPSGTPQRPPNPVRDFPGTS